MKKYFFSVIIAGILFFILGFDNPFSPDPETFGKKVVEVIKTGDTVLYRNTFSIDSIILNSIMKNTINDPYMEKYHKEKIKKELSRNQEKIQSEISKFISSSIKTIELWKNNEHISLEKIQYLRTYFDLSYGPREGLFILQNAQVLIRHDTVFYLLRFSKALLHNNKWYGAELRAIDKLDSRLEGTGISYSDDGFSSPDSSYDTTDVSTVVDTTAVLPPLSKQLDKKLKKIQRKSEKLDKKANKLFEKYY
jgi:hypothetical protein